jgi:hypothetical protein
MRSCFQVIDMLADVSHVTKEHDRVTAAKASLAAGLVWIHIGEPAQAKGMLARAESFDCTDSHFTSILQGAKVAIAS